MSRPRVIAVVVTHQPDPEALRATLSALVPQVDATWLVDNGSDQAPLEVVIQEYAKERLHLCRLGENQGVAQAQNRGIQIAREHDATYVLLMDQDSVPAPDMVECLMDAIRGLNDAASVGPYYSDPRLPQHVPFTRVIGLRLRRWRCLGTAPIIPVDHVISSGCLIPLSVIDTLGKMRDDLFIDAVDIEWGLRARRHGLANYGICSARMQHSLGDAVFTILGRTVSRHSPVRTYYQMRNAILLYREGWIPIHWKLVSLRQMILRFGVYVWCARPLRPYLYMMGRGILHGLRGRGGPMPMARRPRDHTKVGEG